MTKILIDEAVVRQAVDWFDWLAEGDYIEAPVSAPTVRDSLRQALAEAEQPAPAQENLSSEWTPCVKLPVTVYVREQRPNETHVSTREGITPVKPDDLIMRGVQGEKYPIGRKIFEQTYRLGEAEQPAPTQPPNCGTGYCSCIECLKGKP